MKAIVKNFEVALKNHNLF